MTNEYHRRADELICTQVYERYSEMSMLFLCEMSGILIIYLSTLGFSLIKVIGVDLFVSEDGIALTTSSLIILASWFSYNLFSMTAASKGFASLERIDIWGTPKLGELEAPWEKNGDPDRTGNWVSKGEIELKNISVRYREGLPLVLKNVSFKVEAKEKIGVVGRTGSGKSTLILVLKRILELSRTEEHEEQFINVDG